jgi:hypothetical protein
MPDVERLWTAIPVNEDKAEGATEIWRRYDLGARSSLHHKLNRLAAEGRIKRISRPMRTAAKCICIIEQRNDTDGAEGEGGSEHGGQRR